MPPALESSDIALYVVRLYAMPQNIEVVGPEGFVFGSKLTTTSHVNTAAARDRYRRGRRCTRQCELLDLP